MIDRAFLLSEKILLHSHLIRPIFKRTVKICRNLADVFNRECVFLRGVERNKFLSYFRYLSQQNLYFAFNSYSSFFTTVGTLERLIHYLSWYCQKNKKWGTVVGIRLYILLHLINICMMMTIFESIVISVLDLSNRCQL